MRESNFLHTLFAAAQPNDFFSDDEHKDQVGESVTNSLVNSSKPFDKTDELCFDVSSFSLLWIEDEWRTATGCICQACRAHFQVSKRSFCYHVWHFIAYSNAIDKYIQNTMLLGCVREKGFGAKEKSPLFKARRVWSGWWAWWSISFECFIIAIFAITRQTWSTYLVSKLSVFLFILVCIYFFASIQINHRKFDKKNWSLEQSER